MLNDSFRSYDPIRGVSYEGPNGKLPIITTAPCMQMPIDGGPEMWLDFALHGGYDNARVRNPPLGPYNVLNILSVMEILKRPSMSLDTLGKRIKFTQAGEDGPSAYPMHAVKGRLYGWRLWAVEPRAKGELILHFIETRTLKHGAWSAVLADDGGVIPGLTIYEADNHYYEHNYYDDNGTVDIHEWFKPSDGPARLVRSFEIKPDGTWEIFESDM